MWRTRSNPTTLIVAITLAMAVCLSAPAASLAQDAGASAPEILATISAYNYGASREPLSQLRVLVQSSLDSDDAKQTIEQAMIAFLGSDATFAGKQFVCEQLSIIGTEKSVSVLTTLLADAETADIALFALQRIPGSAVDAALRESLAKAEGAAKIGIINTIGQRRDEGAVAALAGLVGDADSLAARSAVIALGKIANAAAAEALVAAAGETSGDLRAVVLDAYLSCADAFAAAGDTDRAVAIYRQLHDNEDSIRVRAASLRGLVHNSDDAVGLVLAGLKDESPKIQSVAVGLLRNLSGTPELEAIVGALPSFPESQQIQLFAALAHRRETAARDAALDASKHPNEQVRAAALAALARIGSEDDISLLIEFAVRGETESDRAAARASLASLPGVSVDLQITQRIADAEPAVKAELIRSIGLRNATGATQTLLATAADADQNVRRESFKSLAVVASPEAIDQVVQLLIAEDNSTTRSEAASTVVLVSGKIADASSRAAPVLSAIESARDTEARGTLLEVLGRIGGSESLEFLKSELASDDAENQKAAIRALTLWPNAEPLEDLLEVARTSENQTQKILALRGFIELLGRGRGRGRRGSGALAQYLTAAELATEPAEKRMILSGLGRLFSAEAVAATANYLDDPDVKAEAEAALTRTLRNLGDEMGEERLKRMLDGGLRETLTGILEKTDDERLQSRVNRVLNSGQDEQE